MKTPEHIATLFALDALDELSKHGYVTGDTLITPEGKAEVARLTREGKSPSQSEINAACEAMIADGIVVIGQDFSDN